MKTWIWYSEIEAWEERRKSRTSVLLSSSQQFNACVSVGTMWRCSREQQGILTNVAAARYCKWSYYVISNLIIPLNLAYDYRQLTSWQTSLHMLCLVWCLQNIYRLMHSFDFWHGSVPVSVWVCVSGSTCFGWAAMDHLVGRWRGHSHSLPLPGPRWPNPTSLRYRKSASIINGQYMVSNNIRTRKK